MRISAVAIYGLLLFVALPLRTVSAGTEYQFLPGLATTGVFPQAHVQFPGGSVNVNTFTLTAGGNNAANAFTGTISGSGGRKPVA